jgi:hypothetical protein
MGSAFGVFEASWGVAHMAMPPKGRHNTRGEVLVPAVLQSRHADTVFNSSSPILEENDQQDNDENQNEQTATVIHSSSPIRSMLHRLSACVLLLLSHARTQASLPQMRQFWSCRSTPFDVLHQSKPDDNAIPKLVGVADRRTFAQPVENNAAAYAVRQMIVYRRIRFDISIADNLGHRQLLGHEFRRNWSLFCRLHRVRGTSGALTDAYDECEFPVRHALGNLPPIGVYKGLQVG